MNNANLECSDRKILELKKIVMLKDGVKKTIWLKVYTHKSLL